MNQLGFDKPLYISLSIIEAPSRQSCSGELAI
jgi:hypothetical protein